jgi:hypothetical protein
MGDLSFKSIGDVVVGDEVIGFASKNGSIGFANVNENYLCKSVVTSTRSRYAPVVKLTMSSGNEIRCTTDHKWLASRYESSSWEYGAVEERWFLARIINPTPRINPFLTRLAGWLAGIYDGEGCGYHIAQYPDANPEVYRRIAEAADALGIELTPSLRRDGFFIKGGRQAFVDFLNIVQPVKRSALEKRILGRTLLNPRDRIISIEEDGEEETFCLTTSTGNYIVWGYASKNSTCHPESVVELSAWPARRFRRFYELHQKRRIIAELDNQKKQMIAALWSNPNWDDKKGTRKRAIDGINEDFDDAIEAISAAFIKRDIPEQKKLGDDNPFFAAADRGLAKVDARVAQMRKRELPKAQVQEINYMKGLDQSPD